MKKNTIKKFTTSATAAAVISSSLIAGIGTVVQADDCQIQMKKQIRRPRKLSARKKC